MAPSTTMKSSSTLSITHIGTATAVLALDGVNFLTDPFFSPAGSSWDIGIVLTVSADPALSLAQLPPVDAVLLSHEDHVDNLDPPGRTLLNGRRAQPGPAPGRPRPRAVGDRHARPRREGVRGHRDALPAPARRRVHGVPRAARGRRRRRGVRPAQRGVVRRRHGAHAAVLNLGAARVPAAVVDALDLASPGSPPLPADAPDLQITMDGRQGARMGREIGADWLVPMHYEAWTHFTQGGEGLRRVFGEEGVLEKVRWLVPGEAVEVF